MMSIQSKVMNRFIREKLARQILSGCREKKWYPEDLARHSGEDLGRINKVLFKQTDITLTFLINISIALNKKLNIDIF